LFQRSKGTSGLLELETSHKIVSVALVLKGEYQFKFSQEPLHKACYVKYKNIELQIIRENASIEAAQNNPVAAISSNARVSAWLKLRCFTVRGSYRTN
jgi:hypothetical protein